ncbi:MAG: FeoB-associated Cys-rich membrane protein [Deltaproteobacteria bacterium]|nr:FeoB-associated Cys-rich membrane protein [Deltaproteobacteria bacterium]
MEAIVVTAIAAGAVFMAGRSFYRTMTGKNKNGCSGCAGCPYSNSCTKPSEHPGQGSDVKARGDSQDNHNQFENR